jgi:hypothetical protein
LFATSVVYTGGKFAAGVIATGGNLPLASLTPVATLLQISTTLAKLVEKFASWCTLTCKYLCEFSKKFETILMEYSEAVGKLIHEKNQKQKNLTL